MLTYIPIVKSIQGFNTKQGFIIKFILAENKFYPMHDNTASEKFNIDVISKGEHVSKI